MAEVEAVDDAHGAVATAGAPDGLDVGVVEKLLQIAGPQGVAARELVLLREQPVVVINVKASLFEQAHSGGDLLRGDLARGGGDGHRVAGTKILRHYHSSIWLRCSASRVMRRSSSRSFISVWKLLLRFRIFFFLK